MYFNEPPTSLETVCSLITDGSHYSPLPQADGHPIVNAKDIPNGRINIDSCTRISKENWEHLKKQNCAPMPGDVLLSKDGTIGRVVLYESDYGVVVLSSIAILRPKEIIDPSYLAYVLQSDSFRRQLLVLESGSALKRIVLRDIKCLEFIFPSSKTEQTKIAEILSTVDQAIEQTEALIAKQDRIKTGLMQALLTSGIDEHGKLRSEQTHQFKDSLLGRIPVEWNVVSIGDTVKEAILGITFRGTHTEETLPLIKMGNLNWGSLYLHNLEMVDQEREDTEVPKLEYRDFLFNTRNTPELVGKTAVWRSEIKCATFDNNILRLRFDKSVASPFLNFYMSFGRGKEAVRTIVTGTTSVAAIYWHNLKYYLFPRPSIGEQERIIKIIEEVNGVTVATNAELHKLRSLKTALMQDLLTGKKRVTPLLNETR